MNLSAVALLVCSAVPTQNIELPNIDFRQGTLAGWVGDGFALMPAGPRGADPGVGSSEDVNPRGKGMLRYVFDVPKGAGLICFHAQAIRAAGLEPAGRLDVLLLGEANRILPRRVRTDSGWQAAPKLLPLHNGRPHEYAWDVTSLAGERLQIALLDQDARPGCHVWCSGFRVEAAGEGERHEFARHMLALQRAHKLPPMARFESKHFTAWSNADDEFTKARLRDCEILHNAFLTHFRRKGLHVRPPATKLMVALFDSQAGFEAYVGQKMPGNLVGLYHPPSNRLVIYDINHNRSVAAGKQKALDQRWRIGFDIDRVQYVHAVEQHARDFCKDANVATTMHEVAHQMSFNGGLLQRDGDVPLWLAEGLACYCEAADAGAWQGIGAPNPERLRVLASRVRGGESLLPLTTLLGAGDWRKDSAALMLGYAQSWALFRMLMEERPQDLRSYLALIRPRRTPDHRLTDFRQVFGADLTRFERRHRDYIRDLVERHVPARGQ